MTYLDRTPRAEDTGSARAGSGPAIPAAGALTAHRPLAGPGAALTAGLLHDWQARNREASLPLALRQLSHLLSKLGGEQNRLRSHVQSPKRAERIASASL